MTTTAYATRTSSCQTPSCSITIMNYIPITNFDALKPYLVSGYIGENWWEFTEDNRRTIAETAITNILFYYISQGRSGDADCAGGTGDKHTIVCLQNANIRILKFGTGVPGGDNCYYDDIDGNEHCYVPDEKFNLPCYYVVCVGQNWGHSMCAIKVNEDIDDLDSWIIFQYNAFDIKPGNWQIPINTHDDLVLKIYEPTRVSCGAVWGDIITMFDLSGE